MGILQDIKYVLKALSRRRFGKTLCPRCGDSSIKLASGFGFWLAPSKYVCRACGYAGPVILEVEEEI